MQFWAWEYFYWSIQVTRWTALVMVKPVLETEGSAVMTILVVPMVARMAIIVNQMQTTSSLILYCLWTLRYPNKDLQQASHDWDHNKRSHSLASLQHLTLSVQSMLAFQCEVLCLMSPPSIPSSWVIVHGEWVKKSLDAKLERSHTFVLHVQNVQIVHFGKPWSVSIPTYKRIVNGPRFRIPGNGRG